MKNYNLIYFPEIDSTNTHAMRNMEKLRDGDVLHAEIQTAGRGRFDRKWISDRADNIYITFVLKPPLHNSYIKNISQYLCLKAAMLIEEYPNVAIANIKWPNDVLIGHKVNKKIAGILAQTSICGNSFKGLALGIGINLNFEKEDMDKIDRPATSLNCVSGEKINRDYFLKRLLDSFFSDYDEFLTYGFPLIREEYIKRAYFLGNKITISSHIRKISGIAENISDCGSLELVMHQNEKILISSGEILEF